MLYYVYYIIRFEYNSKIFYNKSSRKLETKIVNIDYFPSLYY